MLAASGAYAQRFRRQVGRPSGDLTGSPSRLGWQATAVLSSSAPHETTACSSSQSIAADQETTSWSWHWLQSAACQVRVSERQLGLYRPLRRISSASAPRCMTGAATAPALWLFRIYFPLRSDITACGSLSRRLIRLALGSGDQRNAARRLPPTRKSLSLIRTRGRVQGAGAGGEAMAADELRKCSPATPERFRLSAMGQLARGNYRRQHYCRFSRLA